MVIAMAVETLSFASLNDLMTVHINMQTTGAEIMEIKFLYDAIF